MTCHSQGLLEKKDEIKTAFSRTPNLSSQLLDLLNAIYTEPEPFLNQIRSDTESYQRALKEAGVDYSQADPVSRIMKTFNDAVDLKVAAAELSVEESELKILIASNPQTVGQLSALTTNGTVSRMIFSINFQKIMAIAYGVGK